MEDKDEKVPLPPIIDQVKEYAETYLKLARYRAIKRGSSLFAGIVTDAFIVLGISLTFLFFSITLAFFLGDVFHSHWKGFGSVALIYMLIVIIVALFKEKLERPIVSFLIRKIFK